MRVLLKLQGRAGIGLICCAIGDKGALPQGGCAQIRRESCRIHRHTQIDRQRRDQRDHGWGLFGHELQGGELRRPCEHRNRKRQGFEHTQTGLGCDHSEQERKGYDHQTKRRAVAQPLQEDGFGGFRWHVHALDWV